MSSRAIPTTGPAHSARPASTQSARSSSVNLDSTRPPRVRWGSNDVVSHSGYDSGARRPQQDPSRADDDADEDDATINGITLAVSLLRGKLGCAYYDATDDKVYFLEDQLDSNEFDLASLVLGQLLPTTVLTSSTADSNFVSFLESTLSSLPSAPSVAPSSTSSFAGSSSAFTGPPTRLEIRPAREFYAGQSRHALAQLDVREGAWYAVKPEQLDGNEEAHLGRDDGVEGDSMRRNRELRLESFVNALEKSPLALGCAGALVTSITRMRQQEGDLEADLHFRVSGLELMRSDKVMQINAEALTSLQIFEQEAHASMHATRGKEGLSICNIVDLTRSPLGRSLMRQWLIRPSLEMAVIEERHETVACFLLVAADAIRSHLKSVKNVNTALIALLSGRGKLREWSALYAVLCYSILIQGAALSLVRSRQVHIVDRLHEALDGRSFREIGHTINQVIDWETSTLQNGRVCVRPGIDPTLDELRRQLQGLPSLLSEIATEYSRCLPGDDLVDEISFVYFPQLGYLIRTQPAIPLDVLEHESNSAFEFQFESEHCAYYKNDQCRDLDRHIGDLQSLVSDKEIEIGGYHDFYRHQVCDSFRVATVQALLEQVEAVEGSVKATVHVLAEFDWGVSSDGTLAERFLITSSWHGSLLSFAEAARDNDWTRPRMTEEPILNVQGGRHPLAELCTSEFIKNDISLVGGRGIDWNRETTGEDGQSEKRAPKDEKSMIVVAGANMSGKSVYLKQIALITYLAHLGSFVPADKALVGLTDRIITRVSTKESITRGTSAFMIDLQQISYMLRNATPRSLLIIDEFGKGTDSNDGAGLFCGVVQTLLQLGRTTPRVAVATHFQSVFANGLLSPQLPCHLAHMEVLIHDSASSYTSSRVAGTSSTSSIAKPCIETLTHLYRLAPGLMVSSHVAACARLFDLSPRIVERASFVTEALSRFDYEAILQDPDAAERGDRATAEEEEEERKLEELGRRFVAWDLSEEGSGGGSCDDVEEIKARLIEMLS
ncbi:hypothetical protein JCM11491_002419 [Sporobolomyces phaffii]